ncbi:hypothetical protein D8X79_24905, partial [Vibrio parahaemolyticus]|nr:AAA family ATPase [Vibrio parahaemolyticus]EGQ9571428.1 AAA family ATPase [Vibrio parahaemolyticus]EGR1417814.1 hypothetical protein [Vibrio parahaemolyticus]EGR2176239.1 hypothetical protein [Vibrio parahaemolyticus]EID0058494.1 AAA family ATPase [Vibrio parahaemolyticus]
MLLKISVENFHSFKNKVELDFTSKDGANFQKTKFGNVAPVTAIFGKNASGKTNFLKSLNFLRGFCGGRSSNNTIDSIKTFLFNSDPTKFEVEFFEDEQLFNYKLVVDSSSSVSESLWVEDKLVMKREGTKINLVDTNHKSIEMPVPRDLSAIRHAERNLDGEYNYINSVSKFFYCIESNVYHNSFNIDNTSVYNISRRLAKDKFSFGLTEKLLTQFDPSLKRIELNKREFKDREQFYPVFYHKSGNQEFAVSLDQESSAIKRLYGILPLVLFVSAVGGVLVIDELESHLHPQIVNKLLELFLKFNSNNAQLIFTTHQVLLMDILPKDAIWIAEKEDCGSNMTKLVDRMAEGSIDINDISGNYLSGRFDI